ncbi:HAMP domain-containing sensor histidine kinase [Alteromonas sp. ASW11-36]|uniref:histidine kinase n=1 Tax=Alteromonas arenosi TaxID=3055817 RepID=A0ABT7SUU3_9ALTE|nr:HAMP domain-containing sensor histidine kinase [Alteromonas sp. ASW11-36]MDM7859956.1 HAMP domain-containing sensor histidine kinase [Alteromonas sp. ASW11-36]
MQIRSLRQLTLVSFAIALIPLIALLWQSQSDLANIASTTAQDNTFFVAIVGASRNIDSDAIDIERLIRQHLIVRDDRLKLLIKERLRTFTLDLDNLCESLQQGVACSKLQRRTHRLANFAEIEQQVQLDAQLSEFRDYVAELRRAVGTVISQRIVEQQQMMASQRQKQVWSTAILALLSLVLIIKGSQLIAQPFEQLKKLIASIAQQNGELPPISNKGPIELLSIERDLHWLADRLQQLEHLRTALLRHASHELKTPLASIKEGCSLLNEQVVGELNQSQREVLCLLNASTDRLNTLVEQLLDYNLLLQQAEPVMVATNLAALIEACLQENALALNHNERRVDIRLDIESIVVDPDLLRRILDNLLSNAIAHGASDKTIFLHIYSSANYYVMDVANFGKPIALEDRERLFEPFSRGNTQRNDQVVGAGLGLSIVADCARLMQGRVSIVDHAIADVCFRVELPNKEKSTA